MSNEEENTDNHNNENLSSTETYRDMSIRRALKIDINNKGKEKNYKCPFCEKEFSTISILTKHVKTHDKKCIIKTKKLSRNKKKK